VSPTIEAALISGGWAAVVAALGYRFSRSLAAANLKAASDNAMIALDAAHAAQL
jgi:hypothetical protein